MQPDLIRPGLYLSSVEAEVYKEVLDAHAITHILQVGVELGPTHSSRYQYLHLPIRDVPEQDIIECFTKAFAFIDDALDSGGAVLVHCQAGVSRSATVVIGYCMWKDKITADAATKEVTRARSVVWPNPGFKCQLREFEALSFDVSKWRGWSSSRYLSMQYGEDNLGFMSNMLGGAPVDHLLGTGCRSDPTRVLHRARSALPAGASSKGSNISDLYGLAAKGRHHNVNPTDACSPATAGSSTSLIHADVHSSMSEKRCRQSLDSRKCGTTDLEQEAPTVSSVSSTGEVGNCSQECLGGAATAAPAVICPIKDAAERSANATRVGCESVGLMDKEAALLMAG